MQDTNRFLTWLIGLVTALLTLRVAAWFIEQRAHDKEYWLIFAHVIPFLLAIYTIAAILLFAKGWLFRKFGKGATETPGPGA
ncbi:MAG: hypothetical protein L7W94_00885 [Alphaproteobacteria bacterium]|nr:hypothetical protein [Alphaproteobacteria bacterium]